MKFEERLNELIGQVEVPDELAPENIAAMLKARTEQTHIKAEKKNTKIKSSANVYAQRRTIIMRSAAAAAACAVFAVGLLAYNRNTEEQALLDEYKEYEAVSPDSYDDLYNMYTDIYLNGENKNADSHSGEMAIDEENTAEAPIEHSGTMPPDIPGNDPSDPGIPEADIVKYDDNYMYCLKDKTLYIVSKETMETVSTIDCTLEPPIEIYIEGDKLIMISTETGERQEINSVGENTSGLSSEAGNIPPDPDVPANGSETVQPASYDPDIGESVPDDKTSNDTQNFTAEDNSSLRNGASGDNGGSGGNNNSGDAKEENRINTAIDIYDISDPLSPIHTASYKQNGSYTASRLVGEKLYTVTAYSGYRVKPLDEQADLDSFVPAYYINGQKFFTDAGNIIVPAGANSTDYTVISTIGINDGKTDVQAVLGSCRNVYCSANAIYTVGISKNNKAHSVISAFDLSENGIKYRASGSVEGIALGYKSMNEYDGNFRLAAKTEDSSGMISTSIYVLDKTLTVINSAGQLMPSVNVASVRFDGNYARIFESGSETSAETLDLSTVPPTLTHSQLVNDAYLYNYSDGKILGIGVTEEKSLSLTMYDAATENILGRIIFAENEGEVFSKVFADRRAALIDLEKGIIGIPVYSHTEFGTKNCYYVFNYDVSIGFVNKGIIEYTDIDDSYAFERGCIIGDDLYVFSKGRIISVRLSDLKINKVFEY